MWHLFELLASFLFHDLADAVWRKLPLWLRRTVTVVFVVGLIGFGVWFATRGPFA